MTPGAGPRPSHRPPPARETPDARSRGTDGPTRTGAHGSTTAGKDAKLQWALHAHFLLSGSLFAWAIAGPDPAPARPGVPARLLVLGVAIAVHAGVSQLLYGGFLIDVPAPTVEVRGGAEIMYYGGDISELLLAAALVATWRPTPATRRGSAGRPVVRPASV